ncbi:hypothetical protein [Glycomyces buryatensis]|uniref:Head-tail adaptor protein n=1 Tax=Glycomyces buryatensis TaxID=2570927 RepID=A0A4S8Q628_9ACTN|nr:hypothetical protein [Glycomyces buryatensis]THV39618.1 hypothetical protein FAB82_17255 [Glycomyces buryatensis]
MKTTRAVLCHEITVHPGIAQEDVYGNTIRTPGEPVTYRARVWMTAGREIERYRDDLPVQTWWAILPPDAEVSSHDRIDFAGRSFDVEEVLPRLGHHAVHHLTVRLTQTEGF